MNKTVIIATLGLFLTLWSCNNSSTSNELTIEVNSDTGKKVQLSTIAKDIKVVPLNIPRNVFFGEVQKIKSNGDYLFIHDPDQTTTVTCFNQKGSFIFQLNKRGQGPGEYNSIFDFTPDRENKILYTYDRNKEVIMAYKIPELTFIKEYALDKYFMNFDWAGNKYLTISDTEVGDSYYGAEYFNIVKNQYQSLNLPAQPNAMELTVPKAISRNGNNLIYAATGFISKLYQITDQQTNVLANIDFVSNKVPESCWTAKDMQKFRNDFTSNARAIMVQNVIANKEQISFYYVFKQIENQQLAVYNKAKKECAVYSKIVLDKDENMPIPAGVVNGYYVALIYGEMVNDLLPQANYNTQWQQQLKQHNKEGDVSLLMYKL
ncbi:MAG: hypothetical protein CSA94_00515 [Bacteroidetes bacterium]|nr:MAG: hypothetical protein CSA94_00515 [Bacteroidota bacterium]